MRRVLIDANIFVASWALDVLLTLADAEFFEPRWSEMILSEYVRAAEGIGHGGSATKVVEDMQRAFPDAMVKGWQPMRDHVSLPDQNDRHVVAAAIAGGCDFIVTYNLKDFPPAELEKFGVVAIHPDVLLMELVEEDPDVVREAMKELVADKKRPPRTMDEEAVGLSKLKLVEFAHWLMTS